MTSLVEQIKHFIHDRPDNDFPMNYKELMKLKFNEELVKFTLLTEFDIDIDLELQKVMEQREKRFYQGKLRKETIKMYNGMCPISGRYENELLEVAHIIPVHKCDSNSQKSDVNNTLLLWVDIHRFFDKYLISIDPTTSIVKVKCEYLQHYDGKYIQLTEMTKKYLENHYYKYLSITH